MSDRWLIVKVPNREQRFALLYTLCLLLCFSPIKALGQVAALVFIAGMIFVVGWLPITHLLRYLGLTIAYGVAGCFYMLINPSFSFVNHYLFFLTISAFLVGFYRLGPIITPALLRRLAKITLVVLCFEALYGIAQAVVNGVRSGSFDVSNGDAVRGTIEPSFNPQAFGGNAMYAILMSSLLLCVFAVAPRRIPLAQLGVYGLVLVAWMLASVLHTVLFFIAGTVIAILLVRKPRAGSGGAARRRPAGRWAILSFVIISSLLVAVVLPENLRNLPVFLDRTLEISPTAESEKARATYHTLFSLPKDAPLQPIVGLGPGNYSSRAAMIRSGLYLSGGSLPLPAYATPESERYILSLWRDFLLYRIGGGSTYFPFYSWLSLYGETGVIGVSVALALILRTVSVAWRLRSDEFPRMNIAILVLTFYLVGLGLQDNYWEFTQAIFPPVLLLTVYVAYLRGQAVRRTAPGPVALPADVSGTPARASQAT